MRSSSAVRRRAYPAVTRAIYSTPNTYEDYMSNAKHGRTQETPSVEVILNLRAGLSAPRPSDGRSVETRSYVQQITGANIAKTPTVKQDGSSVVYEWNLATVPAMGHTARNAEGRMVRKFKVGNGVFKLVQPPQTYSGWPVTTFVRVIGGQTEVLSENAARAAFGLAPKVAAKTSKATLPDDGSGVFIG
jgi:hypothetical protein